MIKLKDLNKGIDGIEFLRDLVRAFDYRSEFLNEDKTPTQLINEYLKVVNNIQNVHGDTF